MNKWTKKTKTKTKKTKTKTKKTKTKTKKTRYSVPIISSDFESGNIKVIKNEPNNILLEKNHEPYLPNTKKIMKTYSYQNKYENWFYFKVANIKELTTFTIQNISNFENCWSGYNVCYSYDNKTWNRLETHIINKDITPADTDWKERKAHKETISTIKWIITPEKSIIWFAYYVPYPFSKSEKLFKTAEIIGHSTDKKPILMKRFGYGPKKIWLVAGQHPGETINSWILEGFIKRMLERKSELFPKYTFYIIPKANPDGSARGHWYITASGINMNRDWIAKNSPEVRAIKNKLTEYGFDLVFDIHGDEGTKNHFFTYGYKNKHPLHNKIIKELIHKNTHFQFKDHYKSEYRKGTNGTALDDITGGITIEGALKHPIYNYKTLQDEPLHIGKVLADVL